MQIKKNHDALILDTETHALNGFPIEIAFNEIEIKEKNKLVFNESTIFDQLYSIGENKIDLEAMAIHNITDQDIVGKPDYKTFKLPVATCYIIGHNIDYDIKAISKCGIDTSLLKPICTLALSRKLWPELSRHTLGVLSYYLSDNVKTTQELMRNSHRADTDVVLTFSLLEKIASKLNVYDFEDLHYLSEDAKIVDKIYFGQHKGSKISDLPKDYVQQLLGKHDLDNLVRKGIMKFHPMYK